MELTIARNALLGAVGRLSGVAPNKNTVSILSHLLIEHRGPNIYLSATDLEIGIQAILPLASEDDGDSTITLNARKLNELLRASESEDITIKTLDGDHVAITAGRSKFKLMGLDSRSFPAMPAANGKDSIGVVTLDAAELRTMIDRVLFAVSPDDARYNLAGVYLEMPEPETIRFVSTDGHRLALIDRPALGSTLSKGVLLPRKGVQQARKLLDGIDGQVTLRVADGAAFLSINDTSLSMRLIEGKFPDYRSVIPKDSKVRFHVKADVLKAALSRVKLFSNERYSGAKLELDGEDILHVSSASPEVGEAQDEVTVSRDLTTPAGPITAGFNPNYLLDVLGVLGEGRATMSFIDDVSPITITDTDDPVYRCVVMPMRL